MSSTTVNITSVCESGFLRGARKWMKTSEPIVFCHRTPFKCSSPTSPIAMKVRRLTESPDWMPERCVQRVSRSIRRRTNHVYSGWSDACCDFCFAFLSCLFFLQLLFVRVTGSADCDSLLSQEWMMAFIIIMPCGKQLGQSNVFFWLMTGSSRLWYCLLEWNARHAVRSL